MKKNNSTQKVSKGYRSKLTTMMDPDLKDHLKKVAIDNKCSVADILEILVREYLLENKKSLTMNG